MSVSTIGLDEELHQDVALARADRHADADLARPLGDAHEHDVHDADAADEQADRRDGEAEAATSIARIAFGRLLASSACVRIDEVVAGAGVDAVALAQDAPRSAPCARSTVCSLVALKRSWSARPGGVCTTRAR